MINYCNTLKNKKNKTLPALRSCAIAGAAWLGLAFTDGMSDEYAPYSPDAAYMSVGVDADVIDADTGMPASGGNLRGCHGKRDSDRDGFTDAEERRLGTNPYNPASRPTLADNHHKIMAYWPLMNTVRMAGSPAIPTRWAAGMFWSISRSAMAGKWV